MLKSQKNIHVLKASVFSLLPKCFSVPVKESGVKTLNCPYKKRRGSFISASARNDSDRYFPRKNFFRNDRTNFTFFLQENPSFNHLKLAFIFRQNPVKKRRPFQKDGDKVKIFLPVSGIFPEGRKLSQRNRENDRLSILLTINQPLLTERSSKKRKKTGKTNRHPGTYDWSARNVPPEHYFSHTA